MVRCDNSCMNQAAPVRLENGLDAGPIKFRSTAPGRSNRSPVRVRAFPGPCAVGHLPCPDKIGIALTKPRRASARCFCAPAPGRPIPPTWDTPAPTLADVAWKRAKIKSDEFKRLPITLARAEQAIADDLAFLAAHRTSASSALRCVPTLVLAFAVLGRDKQYLMSMCDKIDDQMYRDFVDNIGVWQGYFEGLASLLSTAETRLMVAMVANVVKRVQKKRTRRKAA